MHLLAIIGHLKLLNNDLHIFSTNMTNIVQYVQHKEARYKVQNQYKLTMHLMANKNHPSVTYQINWQKSGYKFNINSGEKAHISETS